MKTYSSGIRYLKFIKLTRRSYDLDKILMILDWNIIAQLFPIAGWVSASIHKALLFINNWLAGN